jgi:hypothetical protein
MIRNLKVIGLALVAAFALSAAAVSTAFAQQGVLTADGPVKLNLAQRGAVGSGANALTAFGGKIECPGSIYAGYALNATPHELIEKLGTASITLIPTYVNCVTETGSVFPTTVDMNGCDYAFRIGQTKNEDTYSATTDIVCPKEQRVQWTIFLGPAHMTKACTVSVGPQTGLPGISVTTDTSSDDLVISGTIESVHVEETGVCGAKTTSEGKIDLDLTVTGLSPKGESTGITVTG